VIEKGQDGEKIFFLLTFFWKEYIFVLTGKEKNLMNGGEKDENEKFNGDRPGDGVMFCVYRGCVYPG
jgi:hypothetical protein